MSSLMQEEGLTLSRIPSNSYLDEPTITQTLAVNVKKAVNAIAVDATGKYVVLGGKKGLSVIDLDEPYEPGRSLALDSKQNKWEISVVEWNPHKDRAPYIASAANQDTQVWNLSDERFELQCTLTQSHQRAISDLAWSLFDKNLLATCSADTYINLWDIRDPKRAIKKESFCGWTAGATQVKWNRHNPMALASAHNGEVRIWDIRKVAAPQTFITAHMAKIYGIDWSYHDEGELVTCSEDKQFWNTNNNRVCKGTMLPGVSILRAKYTPFGYGLVTMAQRNDHTLRMWNIRDLTSPIRHFTGHTDVITAFDWRCRMYNGSKEYQLVTWSKDQHLRLWYIDKNLQEMVTRQTSAIAMIPKASEDDQTPLTASPVDKFSDTPYGIKNLQQELMMLEKRVPQHIQVIQNSLADRFVSVRVVGSREVNVKITFPSLYPNLAPPGFSFTPPVTLTTQNQSRIVEALSDTAMFHVENNRPCLFQCLQQLSDMIQEIEEVEGPTQQASSVPRATTQNNNDDIPCPRICGAVFSATGHLFTFQNIKFSRSRGGYNNSGRLKTYRDLKLFMSKPQTSETVMGTEESSAFFSNYFYSGQNYTQHLSHQISTPQIELHGSNDSMHIDFDTSNLSISPPTQTYSMSSDPHLRVSGQIALFNDNDFDDDLIIGSSPVRKSVTAVPMNTNIYSRDLSYLMPQNYQLARSYKISGDIAELCRHNAQVCMAEDRKDLQQIWRAVGEIMDPLVYNPDEKVMLGNIPWSQHPITRRLLQSVFKHYERLRDIQTLAVLSCALENLPPNTTTTTYNIRQSNVVTPSSRRTLLDSTKKDSYDKYRLYYAEILFRWQLLDKRAEILKFTQQNSRTNQDKSSSAIEFTPVCLRCNRMLGSEGNRGGPKELREDGVYCTNCRDWGFKCIICHLAVKGSSSFCLVCGHGGHTKHMNEWFSEEFTCPTGCGCSCIHGNFRGEGHELVFRNGGGFMERRLDDTRISGYMSRQLS
ncbi:WD repeat-containing protein 59-like [Planoprotostelium fungivorum]|uniref:WD repeat-containing protein 59-like n=1 Tax=Planoprotostelium fungivorum TaxID=1890364 RepID=A0A2P6NL69_9EUKA|nr:WD repeat-containing protein 59-like [Planoprotostelium fungivorum]